MHGLVDYHTHSILSDGHSCYEEMIAAAIGKGLFEIGLSDHLCVRYPSWALKAVDLPVMTDQIMQLKEKYRNRISVRFGIEADYFPESEKQIGILINSLPLDYVIGSVHFMGDWNFDGDESLYGKWINDELYHRYFTIIQQAARSRLFDVIGHLDLIKNYRIFPETDQKRLFDETLSVIASSDLVVELNTSGPDRPCGEFLPGPHLLGLCYDHGIRVTLGSDAHRPRQVGRHFEQAIELLKKTGYSEIVTFEKRKKSFQKI